MRAEEGAGRRQLPAAAGGRGRARGRKILVVLRREYLTRVKTKGFWIATVALPLLLGAMVLLPALLLTRSRTTQRIVVVDTTGRVAARLAEQLRERRSQGASAATFEVATEPAAGEPRRQRRRLDRRVLAGEIDAWLWIGPRTLTESRAEYHAANVSNFVTQEVLARELSDVVRRIRLEAAGYDPDRVGELARSVSLVTARITERGSRAEGAEAGIILAYVLFFLLYTVLLVYGQQVMNGVLEEKSSRVVEIVVSAAEPFELMMGKLLGIGLVGLTQLSVWLGSLALVTLPAVVRGTGWVPGGVDVPTLPWSLLGHFLALFVLGFFVFSTFYAAIGASFNNLQEAQQFASFAVVFVVAPVVLFPLVLNDPDSTLAVAVSLIPPFTPLLLMLRIAVKAPPLWQILVAYPATAAFCGLMVWACGRIYRVGILMYGKKPTLRELWRWMRYA